MVDTAALGFLLWHVFFRNLNTSKPGHLRQLTASFRHRHWFWKSSRVTSGTIFEDREAGVWHQSRRSPSGVDERRYVAVWSCSAAFLAKIANSPTPSHLAPSFRVTPFEFMEKLYAVSYTHLTLPTKRIV